MIFGVLLGLMVGGSGFVLVRQWRSGALDHEPADRRPRFGQREQPWQAHVTELRDATPRTGRR